MSRVYEALKRAEGQQSVDEPDKVGPATAQVVRPLAVSRLQTQPDSVAVGRLQIKPGSVALDGVERRSNSGSSAGSLDTSIRDEGFRSSLAPQASRDTRGPLLVVGNQEYPTVAEQFHRLSLSLHTWATENDKRIFTIMSALRQDGKSFVAINLAASLAMNGRSVVLVDADLRQPVLHHSFDTTSDHGLITYLQSESKFAECLQPTAVPGVLLVPAGGTSSAPAQLLASPRMREFLQEGRSMNPPHYIIIDSPASSLVPEPEILCRLGDASLVVVAANRTPRELVKQTIETIGESAVVGLVLNRFEPPYSAIAHYPDSCALKTKSG